MDNNCDQLSGCRGSGGNSGQRWRSRGFSSGASEAGEGSSDGQNRDVCFRGSGRGGRYRGRNRNENDPSNAGFVGGRHGRPGTAREYVGSTGKKEAVSNGSRDFRGHKREKMDLAKAFESMKFVAAPVSKDQEALEIDFEDVEVYLTDEELAMPPSFGKLRKLMKQCTHLKRFDIVPEDLIVETLEKTRAGLPAMMPGLEAAVVAVPQIYSPPTFCLRLKIQRDRLNFINFVLTDMVEYGKLKRIKVTDIQNGLKVAVKTKAVNGVYVRGQVKAVTSLKDVKVYLQDYGISEVVELSRLVELPSFLGNEPSVGYFAIFAKLLHMEDAEPLLRRWETELEANNEFHCVVENVSIHDGVEIFEVHLSKTKEDGTKEDVVEHLLAESEQRKFRASEETIPTIASFRSVKDLSSLLHSNFEVDIQPCSLNDHQYILQVSAVSVKSPDEMVLSYVSGDLRSPQWIMEMQDFYGNKGLSSNYKIKTSRILPGRCYAWLDAKQSWWYRVRAIRVTETLTDSGNGVLVSVLDRGDVVEVNLANLMEINPRFCCSSALTFRAHLVDVKPVRRSEGWSEEAVDALVDIFGIDEDIAPFQQQQSPERRRMIASGRILDAVVVNTVELRNAGNSDSMFEKSFGLILAAQCPPNRGTVQADLVRRMLACPTGPCSGSHNLAYVLTGVPYYAREDFSASPKSTGVAPYYKERTIKKPLRNSVVLRRDWKNLRKQSLPVSLNFEKTDSRCHIPEPMQMRMGYVKISCEGTGPGKFYVQMQNKWMELDQMMEDLQELGENMPVPSINEIKPGMIALATAVEDDEFNAWCRVVVLSINEGINSLSVFSIDFGSEFDARLSGVRRLPHRFHTIPPFCRRAHLDFASEENQLMPSGLKWSNMADEVWKKMVIEWNSVNPIYYGWSVRSGESQGVVLLETYDQRLYFDKELRHWYPGRSPTYSNYSSLNAMSDHPLMKSFFTSIGIDIVYEKACGDKVAFIPIWKSLQDAGFIVALAD